MHRIIEPKHNKLANQFQNWLLANGFEDVQLERDQIDVSFGRADLRTMAELKIVYDLSSTRSIREALGQIFEYNVYPGRLPFESWLVVLDKTPQESDCTYIERIRSEYELPLNLGWRKRKEFEFMIPLS